MYMVIEPFETQRTAYCEINQISSNQAFIAHDYAYVI